MNRLVVLLALMLTVGIGYVQNNKLDFGGGGGSEALLFTIEYDLSGSRFNPFVSIEFGEEELCTGGGNSGFGLSGCFSMKLIDILTCCWS